MFGACIGIRSVSGGRTNCGSSRFRVTGDGKVFRDWQRRDWGEVAECFNVSLSGMNVLKLEADDAGDGQDCDHAAWADALVYNTLRTGKKPFFHQYPYLYLRWYICDTDTDNIAHP